MKARRITTIVLSIFVAASAIYLVATEVRNSAKNETAAAGVSPAPGQSAPDTGVPAQERALAVYYFHTTARCPTCRKIEALTASAVRDNFPAELASKRITWSPVNIELLENRHFVDDFKLFTKSVVIVDTEKGTRVRWKNLDRIWELVRDEPSFTAYIKNEIAGFLKQI